MTTDFEYAEVYFFGWNCFDIGFSNGLLLWKHQLVFMWCYGHCLNTCILLLPQLFCWRFALCDVEGC